MDSHRKTKCRLILYDDLLHFVFRPDHVEKEFCPLVQQSTLKAPSILLFSVRVERIYEWLMHFSKQVQLVCYFLFVGQQNWWISCSSGLLPSSQWFLQLPSFYSLSHTWIGTRRITNKDLQFFFIVFGAWHEENDGLLWNMPNRLFSA